MSGTGAMAAGLGGVVGTLTGGTAGEDRRLERAREAGLGGVEVRADLLLASGRRGPGEGGSVGSLEGILDRVRMLRERGIPALFTLRLPGHGGCFQGSEEERARIYREALRAGAAAIDVEWGSGAAVELARERAPIVLSHHEPGGMLPAAEMERLAGEMAAARPLAVKVIPTAASLIDSARILEWVERAPRDGPRRIGFAMGDRGVVSRILSISRGAPWTYASLLRPAAPGQLPAIELLEVYRAHRLGSRTRLLGVVGGKALSSFSPYLHNPALERRGLDAVYLPFQVESFAEIVAAIEPLRVEGLSVTIPFKEEAARFAGSIDPRSRSCGAANTLVLRRAGGRTAVEGFNTDFDGVLSPLRRRIGDLRGISAAVVGNGGAARGAALALKEAGASPTLYYRNPERGAPVASELGIPGRRLDQIGASGGSHAVFLNATPLGSRPGDPSPVPAALLRAAPDEPPRIAFEMVYQPAETRFLLEARAAGAVAIPGREMLVAQGAVQFRLFTGMEASEEELAENYRRGEELRRSLATDPLDR